MIKPKVSIPQDKIAQFCKKNHILTMSLFGSILTDQFTPASDIDFLVEFQSEHIKPGDWKRLAKKGRSLHN